MVPPGISLHDYGLVKHRPLNLENCGTKVLMSFLMALGVEANDLISNNSGDEADSYLSANLKDQWT